MRAILLLLFVTFSLNPGAVLALDLGQNITIWDKNGSEPATGNGEDGETEPGMVNSQIWDLEGFFLQQNSLSMVGGYNFLSGEDGYASGDIFISTGVAPDYGDIHLAGNNDVNSTDNGTTPVVNSYGYDYVLDLDFTTRTYAVVTLDEDDLLLKAYYQLNEGSSPWKYVSGGEETVFGGLFSFTEDLTNDATGFSGGSHYALTGFDLSFLGHGTDFYAHFTMGCGNDNLMGQGTVVPEPATFLLFAAGGGLMWLTGRRKRK